MVVWRGYAAVLLDELKAGDGCFENIAETYRSEKRPLWNSFAFQHTGYSRK